MLKLIWDTFAWLGIIYTQLILIGIGLYFLCKWDAKKGAR